MYWREIIRGVVNFVTIANRRQLLRNIAIGAMKHHQIRKFSRGNKNLFVIVVSGHNGALPTAQQSGKQLIQVGS
jgi:hypothetical protein